MKYQYSDSVQITPHFNSCEFRCKCGKEHEFSISDELVQILPEGKTEALRRILELDPRPGYQDDPARIYGFPFAGKEVKFRVEGRTAIVTSIE